LVRIGNSLGVTLPAAAISSLGVAEGDTVDVEVEGNHVVISARASLSELLTTWNPIGANVRPEALDALIREDREAR
jgi:antitoxin component of MazEF toxin-antitoxin module